MSTSNLTVKRSSDGVAMGSNLGPVIAGIFMVELENTLVSHEELIIILEKIC